MSIIKLENLSIGYNKKAILENINLTIKENSCICLYGENGCGKTTLIKTLQTIIPPVAGSAIINNYDIKDKWNIRKICASVFQTSNIDLGFPLLTKEVVLMGRYRNSPYKTSKRDLEIVREVMDITNIWDLKDVPYGHLSGGQRQRANLSLALASEPKILFLDEPSTFLDELSEKILMDTINMLKRKITILVVSHNNSFIDQVSDEIYNIKDLKNANIN